jgi:transposase InsO family protein
VFKNLRNKREKKSLMRLLDIKRTTLTYWLNNNIDSKNVDIIEKIKKIVTDNPAYGLPRVYCTLVSEYGIRSNIKKIRRLYNSLGFQLRKKKTFRKNYKESCIKTLPDTTHENHIWAIDFMHDTDRYNRKIKILNIVDIHTRRCLYNRGFSSLKSFELSQILIHLFSRYGRPEMIISDNGPEFRSKQTFKTLNSLRVKQLFIEPGKPWMNGYIESFNGKYRAEFLDCNIFDNVVDYNLKAERYRKFYNSKRPHSALNYATPDDFYKRKIA